MTIYKMKAETGKLGAKIQGQHKIQIKWSSLFLRVILAIIITGLALLWLVWSNNNDKELMKVDYCWDTNGQHYVSPNINCWNK